MPEGLPTTLTVLDSTASSEQLKEVLKKLPPNCAGIAASYVCGNHDAVPQYSGPIIAVSAGDELAMNSMLLSVVEIDGGGNGTGLIKIPMMNNLKFGLKLEGIKVAKGGCIVAGKAALSGVSVQLLNDELRGKLQTAYAAYTKLIDGAIADAGAIAQTYNSIVDLLKDVRAKAKVVVEKLQRGEKPSAKELKTLQDLAKTAVEAKKKELEIYKRQPGAEAASYVLALGSWLTQQQKGIGCVGDLVAQAPAAKKGGPNQEWLFFVADCLPTELLEPEPVAPKWLPCLGLFDDCDDIQTNLKLMHNTLLSGGKKGVSVKTATANKTLLGSSFSVDDIAILEMEMVFVGEINVAHTLTMKEYEETATGFLIKAEGKNVVAIKLSQADLTGTPSTKDKLRDYLFGGKKKVETTAAFSISGKQLKDIFSGTSQARCDEVAAIINKYSTEYEIDNAEKMSHFIGQIGAETMLKTLDEGSYSASRILTAEKTRTIRSHNGKKVLKYCSIFEGYSANSTGCPYPYCDEDIMVPEGSYSDIYASESFMKGLNKTVRSKVVDELPRDPDFFSIVYACQLNNGGIETGDGYRFRGRGFIQITGQTNYETMVQNKWDEVHGKGTKDFMCRSSACDKNLDDIANDLDFSMLISLTFWKAGKTNDKAKQVNDDAIRLVTQAVNGREIGLPNRKTYTKKSYEVFKK